MIITLAGAASYATPFAAPQNMMTVGWTNYKFTDYLKIGLPIRDTVLKRCEDAKIKAVFSTKELVENSDIVVIAVPARFTASTADGLKPFAKAGQLFADVTTALPPIKEAQAKSFAELGAEYIDSAMLGSLMALGHKVPILASGKGCKRWHDTMTPFNMKINFTFRQ